MAEIYTAESNNGDPSVGGFVIKFPSGLIKSVAWKSQAPIPDTLEAAKEYTAKLLDSLLVSAHNDDAERTNWVSVVACVQQVINDWNERTRQRLYAPHAQTLQ